MKSQKLEQLQMKFDIKNLFQEIYKGHIIYDYEGDISKDILEYELLSIEKKLQNLNIKPNIKKRIFRIIVESIQNLYHHTSENPIEIARIANKYGIFVITSINNNIRLASGNFIKIADVKMLKNRIDQINTLSADEIRHVYRETLNNGQFSDIGGGGLGLLDIARKTKNELNYSFCEYDDNYMFLSLVIKISII